MLHFEVQFGKNNFSLFDNGKAGNFDQKQESENHFISIDNKIQPIQFNKTNKKVLIISEDFNESTSYEVIDFAEKEPFPIFLSTEDSQLINIFWSRIEEDIVIASFKDKINLIDYQKNQIIKSFPINNLTQCKNCQSNSILRQFSLISLINTKDFYIITPFVTDHFTLSILQYGKLKEELPNIKKSYFDSCFVPIENNFYKFDSLFGIDIEPVFYPIHIDIDDDMNIVDFSMKNDDIYALCNDGSIYRISIPSYPSLFQQQKIIDAKCHSLQGIKLSRLISSGPYLFGIGDNCYQFFDECAIKLDISFTNTEIINIIKSNNKDSKMLVLLFSDGSYQEIEDQSIYYESQLNKRFKLLQQRRQEILERNRNVQIKINQFISEMKKLKMVGNYSSLLERIQNIKQSNIIQPSADKAIDLNKIIKDIPPIESNVKKLYEAHSKQFDDLDKSIRMLKISIMGGDKNE
ncbi:hypothetical protein M9Y10_016826 [Tritrichomonas musculus]|uniref:Nucleoporin Nup88 n=1 Tax=Tritrichomonas musculus TaxID=1915356 RepID=A0ABR2HXL2_9EUKA